MERSIELITNNDLRKLLKLAFNNINEFFNRKIIYNKLYRDKQLLIALCQGAALHYIDSKTGIKDFDIWFFFPKIKVDLPCRRRGTMDFGKSKFGKYYKDINYIGRRVDIMIRSDSIFNINNPEIAIINYLTEKRTKSAKLLAEKGIIGLYPNKVFGKILWPLDKKLFI